MVQSITLQNVADTDIVNNDILGQICFAAPNEAGGTDAILIAASIFARSEGTFAADNNATELVFTTGASASAAPGATNYDMTLSSAGNLTVAGTIECATSLTIGSAVMSEADLEFLDGITAGTAAASKAVVLDGSKNIATIGTIGCGAITSTGSSSFATSVKTPLIEYTDGDDAITISDGGHITLAKASKPALKANSDGTTVTFDLNEANVHTVTLGGNRTFAVTNETAGQKFIIRVLQDGTGSRTVSTWFSTIKWAGGSAPTLTTTANKADVFGFLVTGTDTYDGFVVGQNI